VGLFDYVNLQMNAYCTLSDSGTISEESSIMGFAVVNLREAHERPEAMDNAAVIMCGLDFERVMQAIEITKTQQLSGYRPKLTDDYSYPDVSKKVVRIITSYVNYVKRTVWEILD
jgi:UDP-N-acetylglucosamine 2-epimerase (non-hydrolysing)